MFYLGIQLAADVTINHVSEYFLGFDLVYKQHPLVLMWASTVTADFCQKVKKKLMGSLHIIIGTRFGAKGFFQWTCVNILGFLFKINLGFLKCSFKVESLRCTKPFFLCYFSSFINNSYSKYLHSVITCLYSSFWCRWQTLGFQLCNHTLVIHRKWCTYYVMR